MRMLDGTQVYVPRRPSEILGGQYCLMHPTLLT